MNGITIDWSKIDLKWLFTTAIAVYAALLSTYREIQAWKQWRAKLRVQLNLNVMVGLPQGPTWQVQILVENHGRGDVLFNSPHHLVVAVKGLRETLVFLDPIYSVTFPHALKPGGSFYVMEGKSELGAGLGKIGARNPAKIRAVAHDAIGRSHFSAWQKVTAADFQ